MDVVFTLSVHDLPLAGMTLVGTPPVLIAIDADSLLSTHAIPLNWYAQSLSVENIEYSYIADSHTLQELLHQFHGAPRTLRIYKTPQIGPPQITLTLPAAKDVGLDFDGFPPVVSHVNKSSMWHTKVPEGFVVDRLVLSDGKELSLSSGGFTASNVNRALMETSEQEGRVLVLKKVTPKGDMTSSSGPFDLSSFRNRSHWSIKRMFGMEEKASVVKKGVTKSVD
mmetsp:Transcript_829/g.1540  ORF Transcript_829/g.1540 Transcript_829/m.1540 type:complete len:224 (-) Transcript_829:155-826(-)